MAAGRVSSQAPSPQMSAGALSSMNALLASSWRKLMGESICQGTSRTGEGGARRDSTATAPGHWSYGRGQTPSTQDLTGED